MKYDNKFGPIFSWSPDIMIDTNHKIGECYARSYSFSRNNMLYGDPSVAHKLSSVSVATCIIILIAVISDIHDKLVFFAVISHMLWKRSCSNIIYDLQLVFQANIVVSYVSVYCDIVLLLE